MKRSAQPEPAPPEPEPVAEVAEPAAPVVAEPVPMGGVLSALASFQPSAETANYAASMGRITGTMLTHVRDRVSEAVNMLEQIKFDAAVANDIDGVEFVNNLITTLN
jgi:hypothetical protein